MISTIKEITIEGLDEEFELIASDYISAGWIPVERPTPNVMPDGSVLYTQTLRMIFYASSNNVH